MGFVNELDMRDEEKEEKMRENGSLLCLKGLNNQTKNGTL